MFTYKKIQFPRYKETISLEGSKGKHPIFLGKFLKFDLYIWSIRLKYKVEDDEILILKYGDEPTAYNAWSVTEIKKKYALTFDKNYKPFKHAFTLAVKQGLIIP